ncbi:MAG: hypothetical protein JSV52_01135 [Candidatus Zixiibacteriota bacterium]|nr:MAG: hypothetical protein JSV52_01135 [candidate division Zixibacteria bacterium]
MAELKFNKSTDSEEEIKLDSSLVYTEWRSGVATAGGKVTVAVGTSLVGDGATVEVTGKSKKGKKLGKLKGKVRSNMFVGMLDIPEDIEMGDRVFFEVDLPDNSLSGKSEEIPVTLPIRVSNMKWSAKEAGRGDILTLSADIDNVRDDTEVLLTIYEYDQDSAHDRITEIPGLVKDKEVSVNWEYEYHEDTDEIATQEELDQYGGKYNPPEYFFTIEIYDQVFGKKQESKLLVFKDWLEIAGEEPTGEPMANRDYIIKLPDGTEKKGKLDKDGFARVEGIPPGKCEIEIPPDQ